MRVRITFTKQGALRYTGHLDLHRLWERAMRRADLPITYSQGFHPQPRMSLAAALPLGFSSRCEMLDVRLNDEIPLEDIRVRLKDNLPHDIQVTNIESVDERAPALQTQVVSAQYHVQLTEPVDGSDLKRRVAELLESESIPRERRGKFYDLRPLIEALTADIESSTLQMTLAAREGATGRPDEVLTALGIEPEYARVERTRLIFQE
ncbi:MAG TPA: TIGR03936 family radical SAM-associated protein [Anaerolineales bacterium]|nr:TIGR03936 family radical SAM-associated protein [Anaerolineales bacterium]HMV97183.1 TIGR03936 family radical SAM-associated protein [Anaerolineales bacterium]HMX18482.1 TIGR03936 family radical SAM-associated protein [Anaerolineales bacterium]HMX73460.1 TIGR03936 family radical SAM-associated protein [Anaerolineales bacterium]HMZ42237.1 TIGR03936 family radical SAM-associated protein [Anaerolineales bacterium]